MTTCNVALTGSSIEAQPLRSGHGQVYRARENIKHYRRELENGVSEPTRATMLRLLVEEENHLGHTREQLTKLDRHISRLSEIMARHVALMDELQSIGRPLERAPMVLATYNDLMAVYLTHRQTITTPMGRIYCERLLGVRIHPSAENTAARKQCMCAVIIDDGHFQIAIEGRGAYGLPLHSCIMGSAKPSLLILISCDARPPLSAALDR